MQTVPQLPFDRAPLEGIYEVFGESAQARLERLATRILADRNPRSELFIYASAAAALGHFEPARRALACAARLTVISLKVGRTTQAVTVDAGWPETSSTFPAKGPGEKIGSPDWLVGLAAALVSRDAGAESELLALQPEKPGDGVSWEPFWDDLVVCWQHALRGEIGPAGSALVKALDGADPDRSSLGADQILGEVVPFIEVMVRALGRDGPAFTEAIVKALDRLKTRHRRDPTNAVLHLPLLLLAAVRLGERLGLSLNVASPALEILSR